MVGELSSDALLSALSDFEAELDLSEPDSRKWDIPSNSELNIYYEKLLVDKSLGHKIMDLASLLAGKKFMFPLLMEFEASVSDPAKMRKLLRGYFSVLSKGKLRSMAGKTKIDVSGIKSFDVDNFLRVHYQAKHKSPLLFLQKKWSSARC